MVNVSELDRLLALVRYQATGHYVEGLDAFRHLLETDSDGIVLPFLLCGLGKLKEQERSGVAFVIADHFRQTGNLTGLKNLFASGDAAVKAGVLNGLSLHPGNNSDMGPGIIALAVEGATHPSAEVREWACHVFQDQCGWGVDIGSAVQPLLAMLGDSAAGVRRMAAYAVGNACKRRFDWSRHIAALQQLLGDQSLYVPEAAAWALTRLSRAKHDIGQTVPDLVRVLARVDEYNQPQKEAAQALLHHARKSPTGRDQVRSALAAVVLDTGRKEIKKFLKQLGDL